MVAVRQWGKTPSSSSVLAAVSATDGQILHSFDDQAAGGRGIYRASADASPFFETVRVHTIIGFLIDPESGRGGNRDGVGWKLIGRDREHMFQPPFGYYDKDYAGWQPNPPDAEKTKA